MMLDRLNMMVGGVRCMAMRSMSMVGCLFVIAALVVLSGLAMMMCSAFVVLCRGGMVFGAFVCHQVLPGWTRWYWVFATG
jgi:thiosulfate reductase cytochrome b subunit